ncbi:hypothetical protein [Leifsonia sp. NPDC058248]|uniref:hypothetical protein n=1 Tax=Leifsonia sp. NPDC058248 TaxID=3346402 RepID=UPI0036DE9113
MTRSRTPLWIAIGAFVTALCLGVGATAVVLVLQTRASSQPEAVVSAYLGAVKRGDVETAVQLEHRSKRAADVLLTNRAYANATDRMTGFRILDVTTTGSTATVDAEVLQGSGRSQTAFTLTKGAWTPLSPLGIDVWTLRPAALSTVAVTIGAPGRVDATIAGVPLGWKGAVLQLNAFPGTYALEATTKAAWFTLPGSSVTVAGFGDQTLLRTGGQLTARGMGAATAAANAWVDKCVADPDPKPQNCSFGLDVGAPAGEVWTDPAWTLRTRPTLTVGAWDFDCRLGTQAGVSAAGCWPVTTATPGTVTFHADYAIAASGEHGDIETTSPIDVHVQGSISSFTDAGALYQSITWSDQAALEG